MTLFDYYSGPANLVGLRLQFIAPHVIQSVATANKNYGVYSRSSALQLTCGLQIGSKNKKRASTRFMSVNYRGLLSRTYVPRI